MSFFNPDSITFPSAGEKDINTWADYCELFCVLSEDGLQTIDRLRDRLIEDSDKDIEKALKRLALSNSDKGKQFAILLPEPGAENDEEADDDGEMAAPEGVAEDKLQSEFLFLFTFLKSRETVFGDRYPFDVSGTQIRLKLDRSPRQQLYLGIFLASLLRIYSKEDQNKLGHLFEDLCGAVFFRMIPPGAEMHPFGSGGGNAGAVVFTGTFFNKVCRLGELIHTAPTTLFIDNQADHQHAGDGGLDWVGWLPFGDNCSKMPLFFGQCASGNDWMDKEFDAHEDKWRNNLQFQDQYLLYHFITKSFRDPAGKWYKPGNINTGLVLIDRLRLLNLLTDEEVATANGRYAVLVDEGLALKMTTIDT